MSWLAVLKIRTAMVTFEADSRYCPHSVEEDMADCSAKTRVATTEGPEAVDIALHAPARNTSRADEVRMNILASNRSGPSRGVLAGALGCVSGRFNFKGSTSQWTVVVFLRAIITRRRSTASRWKRPIRSTSVCSAKGQDSRLSQSGIRWDDIEVWVP